MRELEALAREAAGLALGTDESEAARQLQICNACRYCEGFCAVFPAMTRRLSFSRADIHYLANLCHNCGACLHACQYAPPHEFAVAFPLAMAKVRARTYQDYAWPAACGALYRRAGLATALSLAAGIAFFLALAALAAGPQPATGANFYAVFPHSLLARLFGGVFVFALFALSVGLRRFWRDVSPAVDLPPGQRPLIAKARAPAGAETVIDVARLTYLGGGHGDGCTNEDDRYSLARRHFHHLTFYGFLLCFAATCVATFDHFFLGLHAPYPLASWPVVLGSAGGAGLLAGPAGLLWLSVRRHPLQGDPGQRAMDRGFIALLLLASATGFALLALRATASMPLALAIHLGVVMALFVTLPWSKFAHGFYRGAALLKHALEKRLPARLHSPQD